MSNIEIQNTKIELAKFILNTKDESLIIKLKELINDESSDFWLDLSQSQKNEIEISRAQFKNGQTEDWKSLKARLS